MLNALLIAIVNITRTLQEPCGWGVRLHVSVEQTHAWVESLEIQAWCSSWRTKFSACWWQGGALSWETTSHEKPALEPEGLGRKDPQVLMGHLVGWVLAVPSCSSGSARTSTWQLTSCRAKADVGRIHRFGLHFWGWMVATKRRPSCIKCDRQPPATGSPIKPDLRSQGVRYCQLSQWQKVPPGTVLS